MQWRRSWMFEMGNKTIGIEAIIFDWTGTLYERNKGLFSYSKEVLQELKLKYKLAVISKVVSSSVEERLKQINSISKYFEVIIADTDKTPEHYIKCMKKLKVKPENTLVVDDRTLRGIKIGNKLGCLTYWVKNGEYANEIPNKKTGQPTKIIKSVKDLLTIL